MDGRHSEVWKSGGSSTVRKYVRTVATIAAVLFLCYEIKIFTIIYRYATPVIITPIANWIGDRYNAKLQAKKEQEAKAA